MGYEVFTLVGWSRRASSTSHDTFFLSGSSGRTIWCAGSSLGKTPHLCYYRPIPLPVENFPWCRQTFMNSWLMLNDSHIWMVWWKLTLSQNITGTRFFSCSWPYYSHPRLARNVRRTPWLLKTHIMWQGLQVWPGTSAMVQWQIMFWPLLLLVRSNAVSSTKMCLGGLSIESNSNTLC